jgi:hypothetical protein
MWFSVVAVAVFDFCSAIGFCVNREREHTSTGVVDKWEWGSKEEYINTMILL